MSKVRRIFVEKKEGFNIQAGHLFHDLAGYMAINSVKNVRILVRYDIQGINDDDYSKALNTIFSEPPVDNVYEDSIALAPDETAFAYEYLPGQFDQRADSAVQCIRMVSGNSNSGESLIVKAAQVVVLKGELTKDELRSIKSYLINPVDSREASLDIPSSLEDAVINAEDVKIINGFIDISENELFALRKTYGLAMSNDDILHCRRYFRDEEKRNPTITEIRMLDTYWSDHCRHTTFLTELTSVNFDDSSDANPVARSFKEYVSARNIIHAGKTKAVSLMDVALAGMRLLKKQGKLDDIENTHEVNACSIIVPAEINGKTEEWLVMFKNETHNHPTEIEPFGGAATCLGGAIRDPLSGRSYVYQAMRVTGSGDPRKKMSETRKGKLPQRKITTEAAHGYSSYGNQIGLATGIVSEIYHEGYVAKRMEIGAVIAAAPRTNVLRENPAPGDVIVLVGGRTGRDGCGGATGSSKEHTTESIATCGAEVQKGNPPTERKIQRLFRNPSVSRLIKVCNDFGAGGVSVAIGELAEGLVINLDNVPKKYEGLDGTELAISESQERMAVLLSPDSVELFIKEAEKENLEAVQVAEVTEDKRVVMLWRGRKIVDIARSFIDTNGVMQKISVKLKTPQDVSGYLHECSNEIREVELKAAWLKNMSSLNVCSQKGLIERFDSTIGSGSVLLPFGGKNQLAPSEVMAAKLPVLEGEVTTGTLMSYGFDPYLSTISPYHGAIYSIVHSVAKIVAAGGKHRKIRLTLQEYFEKLGSDPEKWGKPLSALLGAFTAQTALGIPAIGGKDSMSGTFEDISVPPTLVSFAVVPVDVRAIISPELKGVGNRIVLFKIERDKDGLPLFDNLHAVYDKVNKLVESKKIVSAYTVGFGGIAAALSKMAFGNKIGIDFIGEFTKEELFSPDYGAIVAETIAEIDGVVEIGTTSAGPFFTIGNCRIGIDEIVESWESPLDDVFPAYADGNGASIPSIGFDKRNIKRPKIKVPKPRVIIPVFPGTNCEYDSARAFERAGGIAKTFVINNLSRRHIADSLEVLANEINNSQIIMLPGGFSAGDEPDGSGKFITAVFRNPLVTEATMNLLTKRDGLVLGVCNGFQALIKLGLVPYGEIRDIASDSPTLTFNTIGRHISCVAYTRIASVLSPWLAGTDVGDVHAIPISHGEGRFYASQKVIDKLVSSGQVATQYSDMMGNSSYTSKANPNGSVFAIEGITSPDGRVLGKMGHSERVGNCVGVNIYGKKEQSIFRSGVGYFC